MFASHGIIQSINRGVIVTDGLVLHLDAGNAASYPGSGTTWTDLSGNGNNGTLTNGPTYDSGNGGSIVFDGTNDYVDCGTNSILNLNANYSLVIWVKTDTNSNVSLIQRYINSGNFEGYEISFNRLGRTIGELELYSGGNWNGPFGGSINDGNWHFIAVTVNSTTCNYYLDNNSSIQVTVGASTSNPTDNLYIGSTESAQGFFQGNISAVQIYNRALSESEVNQNFNALKSRYGL